MLDRIYADKTLALVAEGNALLCAWRDAPTPEQMRTVGRAMRNVARAHPRFLFWNAILSGTPNFSAEVRAEVASLTADRTLRGLATAHLILIGGFAGAATRGFLGAVMLAAKPKVPTKVFGDAGSASVWMAEKGAEIPGSPNAARWLALHAGLLDGPR